MEAPGIELGSSEWDSLILPLKYTPEITAVVKRRQIVKQLKQMENEFIFVFLKKPLEIFRSKI